MPRATTKRQTESLRARRLEAALSLRPDQTGIAIARRRKGRDPLAPTGAQWFYARWCALECMHLWPCPPLVREYLEAGDPHLASMKETESPDSVRDTVCGMMGNYIKWKGPLFLFPGEVAGIAAMSAYYAASGNIAGAAEWAINALAKEAANAAVREAGCPFTVPERLEVLQAARLKLQTVFAAAASEITGGDLRL